MKLSTFLPTIPLIAVAFGAPNPPRATAQYFSQGVGDRCIPNVPILECQPGLVCAYIKGEGHFCIDAKAPLVFPDDDSGWEEEVDAGLKAKPEEGEAKPAKAEEEIEADGGEDWHKDMDELPGSGKVVRTWRGQIPPHI